MKIIGKPYSGKLNVRFDEGELEIERAATTPALYSTVSVNRRVDEKSYDLKNRSAVSHASERLTILARNLR